MIGVPVDGWPPCKTLLKASSQLYTALNSNDGCSQKGIITWAYWACCNISSQCSPLAAARADICVWPQRLWRSEFHLPLLQGVGLAEELR